MAGHSKWKNIMHKKGKSDAQRGKIFTKIGREIMVAVKEGGPDPTTNSRLKDCIAKAKANNVPNDNIDRVIKKASGEVGATNYMEMTYEGYGPCGIAMIIEALTDNKNRTAGDIRHYLDKYGKGLGATNSVLWQFTPQGVIVIDAAGIDEDKLTEDVLESGASDFTLEGDVYEIVCESNMLSDVSQYLADKGYAFLSCDKDMACQTYVKLDAEEDVRSMEKLLEMLEDNDDIQNVYHNWEME